LDQVKIAAGAASSSSGASAPKLEVVQPKGPPPKPVFTAKAKSGPLTALQRRELNRFESELKAKALAIFHSKVEKGDFD
jgi:hypothetical protein